MPTTPENFCPPTVIHASPLVAAAIGWALTLFINSWRDDRTKRLELVLAHSERQISEFYSPILALLEKLLRTRDVKNAVLAGQAEPEGVIIEYIYYDYFLKIHIEIQKILREKVHLMEGWRTPPSYNRYLKHFISENIYNTINYKRGIEKYMKNPDQLTPVANFKVDDYPEELKGDLEIDKDLVSKRYEDCLRSLRIGLLSEIILWIKYLPRRQISKTTDYTKASYEEF